MSDPVAADAPALHTLNSVAGAMETAVQAAKHGASDAKQAVENAMPAVSRFVSRFVYTTCYSLSYGIVFPSVFLCEPSPRRILWFMVWWMEPTPRWQSSRIGIRADRDQLWPSRVARRCHHRSLNIGADPADPEWSEIPGDVSDESRCRSRLPCR